MPLDPEPPFWHPWPGPPGGIVTVTPGEIEAFFTIAEIQVHFKPSKMFKMEIMTQELAVTLMEGTT